MSTISHTALRGIAGLMVVFAVLLAIWVARESSTRSGAATTEPDRESRSRYSARHHRAPVARTAVSPQRQHEFEARPFSKVAEE